MYEASSDRRIRDAVRQARKERAEVFSNMFRIFRK